ncbi:MAG: hypothetical protein U0531_21180 [Dehalococcoidia bacterium]
MQFWKHFSTRVTPQGQPVPGSAQVANSAGGFAWAVDDWVRLDRFLILGSEGGSYYASEQTLTVENATATRCAHRRGRPARRGPHRRHFGERAAAEERAGPVRSGDGSGRG